jgi:hypothetical protein
MNIKKNLLICFIFSISSWSNSTSVGFEMTWPLSALLYISNYSSSQIKASDWTIQTMKNQYASAQVDGYYATTIETNIYICLQEARPCLDFSWANQPNTPRAVPSSNLYLSDIVRAYRSPLTTNYNCNGTCPIGPRNSFIRGQQYNNNKYTFDKVIFNNRTANEHYMSLLESATLPKSSLNIGPSSFKSVNGESTSYYFAETGVDIYVPLHMVSPGDNPLHADPDYLNFGPAKIEGSTTIEQTEPLSNNTWLPWSMGYFPQDIPTEIVNSYEF